jgi:hypothetical protein
MESRGRRPERPRPAARKVPVVYYLTRSRHLEHPHFVQVPVASPEGLYLRGQWKQSRNFSLRVLPVLVLMEIVVSVWVFRCG